MQRSTARLILRPPHASDLAPFFAIHGDPATNQYNPAGPCPSLEQARITLDLWIKHWHDHGFGQWAISTQAAPDQVIGFGGIAYRLYGDVARLNLGYRFAASAWGLGYATELAKATLEYAAAEMPGAEVYGLVRPANEVSVRVLEKIGMMRVGELDDVPGQVASFVYRLNR